jgi:hypothetical protein
MNNPADQDPLFQFELKVAQRADELSREGSLQSTNPFELWCAAEREVGRSLFGDLVDSPDFRIHI